MSDNFYRLIELYNADIFALNILFDSHYPIDKDKLSFIDAILSEYEYSKNQFKVGGYKNESD